MSTFVQFLRPAAFITLLACTGGSVGLTLYMGRRNDSIILPILFVSWVLSPFIVLLVANLISNRWPIPTRTTLYSATLVVALASLALYGGVAFGPPMAKPAAVFLLVPLASWLLIVIIFIAGLINRTRSRRGDSVY